MKPVLTSCLLACTAFAAMLLPETAFAQALPAITSTPAGGGGQNYSLSIQTLLFLTALGFIPAAVLMMTGFTRIIIVLSLLRQALGTQSAPPNQVLVGLALFLTFFVMGPVFDKIYTDAYQPFAENKISMTEAMEKGAMPLKEFMMRQTRQSDIAMIAELRGDKGYESAADVPFVVAVPAFLISELRTAFTIGFLLYLPFLVIDIVVSSILMSLGMMMLSPMIISMPFKLMLFVLVDGWTLLMGSLASSFIFK